MNDLSADIVDATLAFYDENAEAYAHRSRALPKGRLNAFLAQLPAGGSILDLGCGGGQAASI